MKENVVSFENGKKVKWGNICLKNVYIVKKLL